MNILAFFESFLYVISTLLFYPVLIGLIILVFWMSISLGRFLREFVERRHGFFYYQESFKKALKEEITLFSEERIDEAEARVVRLLQSFEVELIKALDKVRFAIRVGPALGLMGTLIPMGMALASLAQGNMPEMAGRMVTAFTTAVVGLGCSVVAYLISLVKERWVREDLREMEFLSELLLANLKRGVRNLDELIKGGEK
ncbi:MAG: MotA/TolQ/ExbB proton channel family protein [Thermodesulfobacteriaceae bacterium]